MNATELSTVQVWEQRYMCLGCHLEYEKVHLPEEFILMVTGRSVRQMVDSDIRAGWINLHREGFRYLEFRAADISLCTGEMR